MDQQAVMTTSWDDGHPSDFRLAELLTRYGLGGTFYVPRAAENKTMSDGQLRELSESFEIGAHTMRHTFLDTASDLTAEREINESKSWVETVTGKPCTMFCPPGGKFDRRHLQIIKAAGYTGIRSVELLSVARPKIVAGLVVIPTTLQAYEHSRSGYLRNMVKRRAVGNLRTYLSTKCRSGWVTLASQLLERVSQTGGTFHLWGHSWEIDQTGQWDNLERVLAAMGRYRDRMPCVSNGQLCELFATVA